MGHASGPVARSIGIILDWGVPVVPGSARTGIVSQEKRTSARKILRTLCRLRAHASNVNFVCSHTQANALHWPLCIEHSALNALH